MTSAANTGRETLVGLRVRIIDAGLMPPMRSYAGREGTIERPEVDGCYVRFADNSYVWCWWPELEVVS